MSDPYSLEEVVRAELFNLRPNNSAGRELRKLEAEPPSGAKEKAQRVIRLLREGFKMREVDETAALQALPEALTQELFREKLTALCFSGGGIRSASFCLGVLQALAQRKLLTGFDYLSTVSGGGYIGGWLTAWASRKDWSMARVQQSLGDRLTNKEVENLRAYSNYLTPRAGLMSADTWVGVATIARNLVLNWSLFLPVLLLTVATPKFVGALYELIAQYPDLQSGSESYTRAAWLMLVSASVLYGCAALFISRQILKTQEEKKAEDVAAAAPGPAPRSLPNNRAYGAGNVESALVIVCCVAASACIATSLLTSMRLTFGWFNFAVFGVAGATIWFVAMLVATIIERRAAGRVASAPPQTEKAQETQNNIGNLVFARLGGGLCFGFALLIGFVPLGQHVLEHGDDRYPIVLGILIFIFAHLVGGTVFSALSSRLNRMDDALEWSARGAGWLFAAGFAWFLYATAGLVDYDIIRGYAQDWGDKLLISVGGLSGVAAALFGLSSKTSAGNSKNQNGFNWGRLAVLAAVIFFVVLILECSRLFDYAVFGESFAKMICERRVTSGEVVKFLIAYGVLGFWTLAASLAVNVNKFSLHGFYRNRLIRAYLGASNLFRRPNAFTGFDPGDNLDMAQLHGGKPMLIVNTALNLVHGDNLAWQERKASSFSISRLATGNPAVGYRPSAKYGQAISLGTAMAVSGAAVSPNMGYHSSPLLTFAMTLFNARLGWWLGNPRREAWEQSGPRHAFVSFLMELFGYTTDANRFIYLSDGGHFENLGVYEMLLRRCHTIVSIDVGCDGDLKYEDLGNLVRKARIDLGVEIHFSEPLSRRPAATQAAPYCVVGDIIYPGIEEKGALIYIKAGLHGDEPEDVWSYAAAHPEFPHESTGDQFFAESQFESYRRLGLHIGSHVLGGDGGARSHALDIEARARANMAQG